MAGSGLAEDSGAEFEENTPAQKIVINDKPRAVKPAYSGTTTSDEITDKDDDKPAAMPAKKTTVQPDISAEEAKPDEGASASRGTVDELAEVSVEKKATKATDEAPVNQEIKNLVDNKTFFVPIGQVTKRRNTTIVLIIIIVLVIGAAAAAILVQ